MQCKSRKVHGFKNQIVSEGNGLSLKPDRPFQGMTGGNKLAFFIIFTVIGQVCFGYNPQNLSPVNDQSAVEELSLKTGEAPPPAKPEKDFGFHR